MSDAVMARKPFERCESCVQEHLPNATFAVEIDVRRVHEKHAARAERAGEAVQDVMELGHAPHVGSNHDVGFSPWRMRAANGRQTVDLCEAGAEKRDQQF